MPYVTTSDGVDIFYKDWGPKEAQPIHFHHRTICPSAASAPAAWAPIMGSKASAP